MYRLHKRGVTPPFRIWSLGARPEPAQERLPDELIVVDDGSRDRSAEIAEATGELLGFLDADDLARPRRLALQVAALAAGPGLDAVIGHVENFLTPERAEALRGRVGFAEGRMPGYLPGALLMRNASFPGFDESLPAGEVVDFFARVRASLRLRVLDEVVLLRRVHGGNVTLHDPALHAGYLEAARRAIARSRA